MTPQQIRDLLTLYGLTQREAAAQVGVSLRQFQRYVSHTRPQTMPRAVQVALIHAGR